MSKFIIFTFIIWRLGLFITAFVFQYLIHHFGAKFPYWNELLASTGLPIWVWSFGNFDGVHYLTIAKSGYSAQFTQAFFPFYPLIIRIVATILPLNYFTVSLVLSNLFTLIFLFLFAYLLRLDKVDKNTIKLTIIFTLIYPFSLYLGSIYNEGIFLSLVIGAFIAARKQKWFIAGLLGFTASLTRFVGIFLLPALFIEWQSLRIQSPQSRSQNILWLLLIPAGLLVYMFYLNSNFGDPLYFLHAQTVFGASRTATSIILPPQVLWRYLKIFVTVNLYHYEFWVAGWEIIFTLLFFCIYFFKWATIRRSYLLFSLLAVITPIFTGTLSSMPRYMLIAFPLYILHAQLKNKILKYILIIAYTFLLIVFTGLFTRGYWVS